MVTRRWKRPRLSEERREVLGQELARSITGDVRFDATTRAAYASDSSNYRQVPLGVVLPRDEQDVQAVARIAAEAGAALVGRGAGTSLAGQACNEAVVVDMSRYMTKIVEVDPQKRLARAEPGVVLDELRRAAGQYGLTFGPDPATHAWCTLGGMVGNNSCGTHGLYAGKTSDNVESLRVVLAGGEALEVGRYTKGAEAAAISLGGRLSELLKGLRALDERYGALVAERFPDIPRRVSGFNLDQLRSDNGMHVARALVGSESTCAFSTEMTLRLVASPAKRALVVLGYPDIYAAAEAVPELLAHPLLGLEGFDRTLVEQSRAHRLNAQGLALLPEGDGWLLAELGGESEDEARAAARALVAGLPKGVIWKDVISAGDQRALWAVRESALGATAMRVDGKHNYEGWEDAAVPPQRLAEYLRGVSALWAEHGYSGAWYGHFGQGCVHTRNNFDFRTREGLAQYRRYVTAAAELVVSLGGSLSGEHGDGQSRGELLEVMYGPELVGAFGEFKRLWDPDGLMNPGKVVDANPLDSNVRYFTMHERPGLRPTGYAFAADDGSLMHAAARCVGVGRCRRDDTATMCPSYRATRDEVHSTRGRAKILGEMFQAVAPGEEGGHLVEPAWDNEPAHEALELCLSCKACKSDCPTHVDMATYKSELNYHYYKHRARPAIMYALGLLPWATRYLTASPRRARSANAVLGSPARRLLLRAGGVTTKRAVPRFSTAGGLRRSVDPLVVAAADRAPADSSVVVWPDSFTEAFLPADGADLVHALSALGEAVAVPSGWACCGRTLYDSGMLDLAKRSLRRLVTVLAPWVEAGLSVVVAEPSCLAAFRDELPELLHDDPRAAALASSAKSPAEFILERGLLDRLKAEVPEGERRRAVLHPHCHQRAVIGTSADQAVLAALGYEVEVLDAGCCGLAGSFGFDARTEALSRKIGEEFWLPKLRYRRTQVRRAG
ncbi:MAG: FAD-binding oxidoreductase [Actinobacteria bacterium]|nr:FAD-binding oxidoreductase [Actinomycetota bacterium]